MDVLPQIQQVVVAVVFAVVIVIVVTRNMTRWANDGSNRSAR